MKSVFKYIRCFNMGFQSTLEYRANFFWSIISTAFPIIIQFFLWTAIYNSSGKSMLYGYTYQQMIVYTILAQIITKFLATGIEYEISSDIKGGGLSKFIVQPINYFTFRLLRFLGAKSMQMLITVGMLLGVLVILNLNLDANIEIIRMFLFLLSLVIALTLNFIIFFCLSTFAFWLSDAWGIFFGGNFLITIMSGGIFPLDVFNKKILKILDLLPFKYAIYYPINILNGKVPDNQIFTGMLMQLIWIVFLSILLKLLWERGMKKYVAVGG